MPGPHLVRRREGWWPTVWGWLALLVLASALAALAALELDEFLNVQAPARGRDGSSARTLIVEGWLEARQLDGAVDALRRGQYVRVLTTGGPIESWNDESAWPSYADRAAAYLRPRLTASIAVHAVPAPDVARDRTYASARAVAAWLTRAGLDREPVDVYSASLHTRRSRTIYRLAFEPDTEVGVLAAPRREDETHWWSTSRGAKAVVGETLSLAWTTCCFWPPTMPPRDEVRKGSEPSTRKAAP